MNILANDGISPSGLEALKEAGHTVYTDFIEASELGLSSIQIRLMEF